MTVTQCPDMADAAGIRVTRLYLVSHGATRLSAEDRFAGSVDVELSDGQAAALGARLNGERLDAVYSSPMSRTRETAAIVGDACGLPVTVAEGLAGRCPRSLGRADSP